MAQKFTITAELNLQTKNIGQVVDNLKKQFQGADLNIKIKDLAKAESQMRGLSKTTGEAERSVSSLGGSIATAAKKFSAITLATGTLVGFTRAIKNAVGDAIEFEREIVKIAQATGKTVGQLKSLQNEVSSVASSLGVSSKELILAARSLTQAGFAADKVTGALRVLAQTEVAATFDSIADTTEGAIALLNQFGRAAQRTGSEVEFLERSLSAINQVSKDFAVESSDLITAVRTTGSAFESAGGSLNELLALFTSVRSTTRESAESIATGFRTIFTRVQRVDTINALRNLGIELQDVEGKFVGPMEATKRLSTALSTIDPRDFRFNLIVEELGGFRQVSKVIPLIQQFAVAQKALNVAQNSSGSLAKDAATAQQALSVQIAKTKENFQAFVRELVDSSSFQNTVKSLLSLADSFIRVADTIKPLIPLIAGFAAIKVGQALGSSFLSVAGGRNKKAQGGKIHAFASGGMVPGSGNGDTVPAMLTPGEFVIRKSSVKKLGAENLARANKYAGGGEVQFYKNAGEVKPNKVSSSVKKAIPASQIDNDYVENTDRPYINLIRQPILLNNKDKKKLGQAYGIPKEYKVAGNGERYGVYSRQTTTSKKDIYRIFEDLVVSKNKEWELNNTTNISDEVDVIKKNQTGNILDIGDVKFTSSPVGKQKLLTKATQWMVKQDNNSSSRRFFKENLKNKIDSPGVQFTVFEPPFEEGFSKNAILESMGLPRDTTEAYYNKINSKVQKFALGGPAGKSRAARAITIPRIDSYTFDKPAGADLDSVNSKKQQYKLNAEDRLDYDVNNVNVDVSKLKVSKDLLEQYNTADDQKRGYRFEDILKETGMAKSLSQVSNARLDGITAAGDPFEAKSRKSAIGISELEDKLYGAISDNISDPEKLARARFNANDLTEKEDHIKIGKVTVFEDVTRGLGAAVNTKARMGYAEEEAAKQAKEQNKMASVNAQQKLQDLVKNNFGSGFIIQGKQYSPVTKADKVHPDVPTNLNQLLGGKYQDTIGLEGGPAKVLELLKTFIVRNPVQNKASGGSIASLAWLASGGAASGTDTVPAMLTPGEYVINKKSAQAIGSSALNRMNKVGKFASGGPVGVQNFAGGGDVVARTVQTARLNKFLSGPGASQLSAIDPKEAQKVVEVLRKIAEGGRDIPKALKYVEEQIKKQGTNFKLDYKGLSQSIKAPKEAPSVKLSDQLKDLSDNTSKTSGNLLIMASVAESVVAQMSGLSDETKSALSAFGATFATYKVIGDNLKNLGVDIYIASLKRKEEQAAIDLSIAARTKEAATITKNSAASGAGGDQSAAKFAKVLQAANIALTGFSVVLAASSAYTAYFSKIAEKSGKELDKTLEQFRKNPEQVGKQGLVSKYQTSITDSSRANFLEKNNSTQNLAGGAALGAAIGTAILPGIGTAIGAVTGAIGAFANGIYQSEKDLQSSFNNIKIASNSLSGSLYTSIVGIKNAQKFIENIDKKTNPEVFKEVTDVTNKYADSIREANQAELAAIAMFGRLEDAPESFRRSVETAREATQSFSKELDNIIAAQYSRQVKEINSNLNNKDFNPLADIGKFVRGQMENIAKRTTQEVEGRYRGQIEFLKSGGREVTATGRAKAAEAGASLERDAEKLAILQGTKAMYEMEKALIDDSLQLIRQKEALMEEDAVRQKLVGTLIEQLSLESALKNFEYSIKKADNTLSQIGAAFNGSVSGLKSKTPDSSVLDSIIPNASNMADYQNALKAIASIGPAGQKIADNFKDLNKVIPNFKARMAASDDFRTGKLDKNQIEKFVTGLGIDANGEVGKEIQKMIQKAVAPAEGGGPRDPAEIQKRIGEELDKYAEMLRGSGKRILDAITANEQSTAKAYDEINASRQRQLDLQMQSIDGYEKLVKNVAAAQGRTLSLIEKNNLRFNRQRMLAGNMAGNPVGIGKRLGEIRGKLGPDNVGNLNADQRAALQNEAGKLTQALKELADQSGRTSDTLEEIEKIKAQREAVKDAAKEYTFGGVEERAKLEQSVQALGQVMATGNIDSIPDELKSGVQSLLDRFKDVPMFNGMTGKQVENKLIANKMREIGANDAANMIEADTSTPEQKLTQELYRIAAEEQAARQQLFNQEAQQQAMQMDVVNKNTAALQQLSADLQAEKKKLDDQQQAGVNELGAKKEKERLAAEKKELEDRRKFIDEELKSVDESIKALVNTISNTATALKKSIDEAREKIEKDNPPLMPGGVTANPKNKKDTMMAATGGIVYAAKGQLVNFQPKGTDTVPAMLTPGEFVMRKAAVQKYGGGMMKAINAGRFEAGGPAAPGDGDGGGGTTGGGTTGGGDTGVSPTPIRSRPKRPPFVGPPNPIIKPTPPNPQDDGDRFLPWPNWPETRPPKGIVVPPGWKWNYKSGRLEPMPKPLPPIIAAKGGMIARRFEAGGPAAPGDGDGGGGTGGGATPISTGSDAGVSPTPIPRPKKRPGYPDLTDLGDLLIDPNDPILSDPGFGFGPLPGPQKPWTPMPPPPGFEEWFLQDPDAWDYLNEMRDQQKLEQEEWDRGQGLPRMDRPQWADPPLPGTPNWGKSPADPNQIPPEDLKKPRGSGDDFWDQMQDPNDPARFPKEKINDFWDWWKNYTPDLRDEPGFTGIGGGNNYLAKGGMPSATDSIHAMLTPGEFVINKKAAEKIGYDSLKDMNSLQGFAKGGPVGYYAEGGVGEPYSNRLIDHYASLRNQKPQPTYDFNPAKQQSSMTEQTKLLSFLVRLKDIANTNILIGGSNSLLAQIRDILKGLQLNNVNGSAPSVTINNNAPATDNNKKITKEDLDKFYKSLQESRDRRSQVNQQQLQQGTRTGFDTSGAIASPGPIGPRQMAIRARSIKRSQANQSQNPAKKTRRGKSTKDQPTSTLVDEDFFTTFPDAPKPSPPPVPVERDAQGRKVRPKNSMYTQEQWDAMQKKADAEKKLSDARAKALEDEIAKDLTDNGKRASGVGTVDPRNQKMSPRDRIMKMYGKEGQRPKIFPTDEAWYRDIQKRQNEEDSAANQDLTKRSKKSNEKRGTSDYGKPSALPSSRSQATQDAINKAKELQKSADDLRERQTGLKPGERYQKPSDVPVLTPSEHGTVKPMTPAELDAMEKEAEKAVFTQEELLATQDKALRKMKEDANKVHRNMKKQYEGKDAYSRYLNALGKLNAAKAMRDRYQPKQPKAQSPLVDENFFTSFPDEPKQASPLVDENFFTNFPDEQKKTNPPEPQTPPASPFVEKPQELLEQEKKTAEEARKAVEEAKKKAQAAVAAAKAQEEARKNQERAAKEAQENQKKAEETARQKAELDKAAQKAREDELKAEKSFVGPPEPYKQKKAEPPKEKPFPTFEEWMQNQFREESLGPKNGPFYEYNLKGAKDSYAQFKARDEARKAEKAAREKRKQEEEAAAKKEADRQKALNDSTEEDTRKQNALDKQTSDERNKKALLPPVLPLPEVEPVKPPSVPTPTPAPPVPYVEPTIEERAKENDLTPERQAVKDYLLNAGETGYVNRIDTPGGPTWRDAFRKAENLKRAAAEEKRLQDQNSKPQSYNAGGLVSYLARGGSPIFKPKGTDTVPAMLSPGEYVIRKSAVDKIGVDALQSINNSGKPRGGAIPKKNEVKVNRPVKEKKSKPVGMLQGAQKHPGGTMMNFGGFGIGPMGGGGYGGMGTGGGFGGFGGYGYGAPLVRYDTYNGQPFGSLGMQEARNWYMGQYYQNFVQKPNMWARGNSNIMNSLMGNYMNNYYAGRSRGIGKTRGRGFDAHGRSTGGKVNYRAAGGKMSGTMGIGGYAGVDDMIGTGLGNLSVPFSGGFGYGRPLVQYDTYNGQPFGSLSMQEAQNWYMGQYNQNFVQKPAMMAQANNNAFSRMRGNYMNNYAQGHNDYMSNIWAKGGRGGGFAHFKPYHGKSKKGQFDGPGVDNVGGGRFAGTPKITKFASGGSVGEDTVPAMLTPGEFVMNKNAVDKHGMNFMDHLNRGGKVQGFATGGPVYRAIGGSTGSGGGGAPMGNVGVSIDLSAISTTISNSIGAAFSKVGSLINPSAVTQIVSSFSSFIQSMNNMLSKVSGMQMTHTVNISGGISVTGINSQAIANVVSNAVTDEVANLVRSEVMRQFNEIMNQTKSE